MLLDSAGNRSLLAFPKDAGAIASSSSYATRSSVSTASSSTASVPEPSNSIIGLRDRLLLEASDDRYSRPPDVADREGTVLMRRSLVQLSSLRTRDAATQTDTVASMTANAAAELRTELTQLRLSQLRKRGLASGITSDVLEEAEDTDSPHEAMLQLVLGHEVRKLKGTIAAAWSDQDDVAQEEAIKSIKMLGVHADQAVRGNNLELENEVQRLRQRNEELESKLATECKLSSASLQLESEVKLLCSLVASLEEQLESERSLKDAALKRFDDMIQELNNQRDRGSLDSTHLVGRPTVPVPEQTRKSSPEARRRAGTSWPGQAEDQKAMQQLLRDQELSLLQKDARIAQLVAALRGAGVT